MAEKKLPHITQYDPNTYKDPLDYVKQLKGIPTRIWFHCEKNDRDVSNKDDCAFVQELLEVIPTTNLYISCTDNGGHSAYGILINKIIHAVNKHVGVSHLCDDKYHTREISTMMNDARIKPEDINSLKKDPTHHFENFSQKYSIKKYNFSKFSF